MSARKPRSKLVGAVRRAVWSASISGAAERGVEVMTLPPREVFLEVTAHCNIKCPMCPVTTGLERARGTMRWELFEKILDDVAGKVPQMSLFLAGEPLLHKRIFDMVAAASARGVYTRIHTNVLLLTEEKIGKVFDSGLDELSFSFDGPTKERYDRVRVGGDYDKCVRLIKRVMEVKRERRAGKPLTKIQIVYFAGEDPAEQERQMREIFADNLPDELKMVPAHSWAGEYQDFVRYRENVGKEEKLSICHMPWDRMSITWDGNVVGCCNDFLARYINGNVKTAPVLEVWNSPAYQRLRRSVHRKEYGSLSLCAKCDVPWAGDSSASLRRSANAAAYTGFVAWRTLRGTTLPEPRRDG
ncbi:MAG: SPASM domain-containing protein [Candidatus Rokubacteria bacterium]|nr:SPASM domain-containing protein [Candidatus Rokubacteria bacterium]